MNICKLRPWKVYSIDTGHTHAKKDHPKEFVKTFCECPLNAKWHKTFTVVIYFRAIGFFNEADTLESSSVLTLLTPQLRLL